MPPAERPARRLIDFDEIDGWVPGLSGVLSPHVPRSFGRRAADAAPEFVEDALALLFESAAREAVIDATLDWIRSAEVAGYHGSRLTDEEVASVRSNGLVPLEANARRERLARALSAHPRWHEVADRLGSALRDHGPGGKDPLAEDGKPTVVRVAVPGTRALAAAHPHFGIDDMRAMGNVPNLVKEFLEAWSYKLAHPAFHPRTSKVDCGMVFCSTVPAAWIVGITTLVE